MYPHVLRAINSNASTPKWLSARDHDIQRQLVRSVQVFLSSFVNDRHMVSCSFDVSSAVNYEIMELTF